LEASAALPSGKAGSRKRRTTGAGEVMAPA
jgi:hypothetical protein